jgi:hypothetical protein
LATLEAGITCNPELFGNITMPPSYRRYYSDALLQLEFNGQISQQLETGGRVQSVTFVIPLTPVPQRGLSIVAAYPGYLAGLSFDVSVYQSLNFTSALIPLVVTFKHSHLPLHEVVGVQCLLLNYTSNGTSDVYPIVLFSGNVELDQLSVNLLLCTQICMWFVALGTLAAALLWVFSNDSQGVACDMLAFSAALLFALPTMRQLWPAALQAAGGTLADVMNVYAQLMLTALAIVLQLGKVIYLML